MLAMRELVRADMPTINAWRADEELISRLGAPYRLIGPQVDEAWFDSYLKSRTSNVRGVTYEEAAPDVPLCLTSLTGINWTSRSATLHIMIGDPDVRGKGVGTWSVRWMLRHAFADQGLHRVELSVLADNAAAIRLYEKCGFSLEGTRREACYKQGKWVDMLSMSILDREWDGATQA